ncbi:MAG: glycoside hydrolase TIM-barrel-like domain-containing protein [Filomicrobium sp.]
MATLALSVAGAAVGSSLLPAGVSVLGATLSGAAIGAQVGALAGSYVDQALFGTSGEPRSVEGPRLSDLHVTASSEGAAIPRVFGRVRLGGQMIWATDHIEEIVRSNEGGGVGKGIGGVGAGASGVETVEYRYYANFAVAICEGEITGLGRVWADGAELDLSAYVYRLHKGSEGQEPDGLIVSTEGAEDTPAYRGLAYIVFERMPLAEFGNRIPQLSFEVHRAIDRFHEEVRSVVLIPGSGEFVYAPEPVTHTFGIGGSTAENVHTVQAGTDWKVAIDQLQEELPNVKNISLVVSWFGTDLRAGSCEVRPGVEVSTKTTLPENWRAGGVNRQGAHLVSRRQGRPAYGGTPSDQSVVDSIQDLKERGLSVTLTPFILMDVAADNTLPDPYSAASSQPAYPWRGRITCDPAPGEVGSPDKTAAAATQIDAFVGQAQRTDFALNGETVTYSGPNEWSYRRMVLHQAFLAKAAGGVDAFLLGTELRGLSWVRDSADSYPFVDALIGLAADVKAILGNGTQVTYAADWTEYFGHQPQDGSGDVYFHLDPLWASPNIDAVGIDCYWPLADWRDGRSHLDYLAGARSTYDLDYLRSNIEGGEGYDWYYAGDPERNAQLRTPITDGTGKPWVFRFKDVRSWWLNQHFNRPGGTEVGTPTAWVPESKPIWLMEIGCPATDKGANQPNVFVDPKSSENALPYYSTGRRDDLMQRRYIQALIHEFDPIAEGYSGSNPVSSVYAGRMIDFTKMFVYCWDARPYPAFPYNLDVWGDGENWRLGHWLNGRLSGVPLADLVTAMLDDFDFTQADTQGLAGTVPGYVVDRPMTARDALQPLGLAYFFDAIESGAEIAFRHRGAEPSVVSLTRDELVETKPEAPLLTLTRAQETDLPASAKISYIGGSTSYAQAVAEARRLVGASGRLAKAELPIVMEADQAAGISESWLFESWASRERARCELPPSLLELEPGDVINLESGEASRSYRITEVGDAGARRLDALSIDPDVYHFANTPTRETNTGTIVVNGAPRLVFLDLPLLTGNEPPASGYVAAVQDPWPGVVAVYGSPEASGFRLRGLLPAPAVMGVTTTPVPSGPPSRIDYATRLHVELGGGELSSVTRTQLLAGANVAAIRGANGVWEVIQFETAELLYENAYELTSLLRGQAGSELAIADEASPIAAGADFVLLDGAVTNIDLSLDELRLPYTWRYGRAADDLAGASFAEAQHAYGGIGLRPYAPVHLSGTRASSGDLEINWIRRTRIGGDNWEISEPPVSEDDERYEVDILAADQSVVRTLASQIPSVSYTAAEQIADFGALQAELNVEVFQLSAQYGRGAPAEAAL